MRMRGIALIETQQWNGAAAHMSIDTSVLEPENTTVEIFPTGYAAAQRGDLALASDSLTRLQSLIAAAQKNPATDAEDLATDKILVLELEGLLSSKAGHLDQAIAQVQRAVAACEAMPFAFGPPVPVKPPNELLGELLLQQKQYPQALAAFTAALRRAPRRTRSLLGLARAQSALGDRAAATASYRELLQIWQQADPGYAPRQEALHYLSALRPAA